MRSILVDAGPLIALFARDDAHHAAMRGLLRDTAGRLITTGPVVAAETLGIQEIVSLDRDFEIYRIAGRGRFQNLYLTSE